MKRITCGWWGTWEKSGKPVRRSLARSAACRPLIAWQDHRLAPWQPFFLSITSLFPLPSQWGRGQRGSHGAIQCLTSPRYVQGGGDAGSSSPCSYREQSSRKCICSFHRMPWLEEATSTYLRLVETSRALTGRWPKSNANAARYLVHHVAPELAECQKS